MTACVSTSPGNDSSKPVAADVDDAKPAPYTQDGDESNGPEPIEWEVLEERDGMLLLISRYILETKPYNVENEDVTWETCSLFMNKMRGISRRKEEEKLVDPGSYSDEKKFKN